IRAAACSSVRPVSVERFPIWPITAPPRMAKTPNRQSSVAITSRITPAPITAPDVLLAAGAAGGAGFGSHAGTGLRGWVGDSSVMFRPSLPELREWYSVHRREPIRYPQRRLGCRNAVWPSADSDHRSCLARRWVDAEEDSILARRGPDKAAAL